MKQTNKDTETTLEPRHSVTSSVSKDATKTTTMTFMAVKHYDPQYYSQSGRLGQELALAEGDIVRQLIGRPITPLNLIVAGI